MIIPTDWFNRTATVQRPTSTPDGAGGWSQTWAEAGQIPVRCSQPSSADGESAQAGRAAITHVVYALPGADVRRGDRLHLASQLLNGVVLIAGELLLDVDSVVEPSEPVYRRAACVSVQTET